MQRTSSVVVSVSRMKGKTIFLVLIGAFILGLLYGVLVLQQNAAMLESLRLLTGELSKGQSLLEHFFSACTSALFFLFLPYLLGYSAIGQPVAVFLPFFKGLGLGAFLGSLYASHGLAGMGYAALIVIPAALVLLFALLIACRESIKLSNLIFFNFFGKSATALNIEILRLYHIKFLILFGLALCSAVISAICMWLFSRLFAF